MMQDPENGDSSKKTTKEKVKCSLCSYSAVAGYRMKRHMRVHTGEKPFMCGMCDQSFTQKSSLKEHLWKHTGLQSCHKCPHCNAMFNQQADVTAHITHMHTGCTMEMPCPICPEVFADRYSLLEHQKLHDNMFRYQCLECAFSSRDKQRLILHMSIHSKRKPPRCNACKAAFTYKHNLLSHLYQKHNINTFGDDLVAPAYQPNPAPVEEPPKKLTNQQELEQLYQIIDEHGNTLQLSEADAEAIHNAVQQSSEDGTLQIIENAEECAMTVTVLTVAHDIDGSVQSLVEGGVSEEVVMGEAMSNENEGDEKLVESTDENAPSVSPQ